jgi:hypothetical protein
MIFFSVSFNNTSPATVSIRRMSAAAGVWAYEVQASHGKRHRGTVSHDGPENFSLIAEVMNDYVRHHERAAAS